MRVPALLIATLALTACVTPTGTTAPTPSATSDSGVGPGAGAVDGISASMIFGDVCVATAPSFRKAPAIMANMPFRQRPETGTYYHQNLDLSIKLLPKRCSMVFGSKDDPGSLAILFGATVSANGGSNTIGVNPDANTAMSKGPAGTSFEFTPLPLNDGNRMYRAVLIAR